MLVIFIPIKKNCYMQTISLQPITMKYIMHVIVCLNKKKAGFK